MKKITTTIKTMFIAAIVLVMAQSCVPNEPVDGNPMPNSGTFNVGINSLGDSIGYKLFGQKKVLWIDEDSIGFKINYNVGPGSILNFNIASKSSGGNSYEFYNNMLDDSVQMSYLPAGINVTHLDSVSWIPSFEVPDGVPSSQLTFEGFDRMRLIFEGTILFNPITFRIPENTNKYFVFRKQKGNSYMYFWVKATVSYDVNEPKNSGYSINILNGKYQMDSIITGQ